MHRLRSLPAGADFAAAVREFVVKPLRKGVPSLFRNLKAGLCESLRSVDPRRTFRKASGFEQLHAVIHIGFNYTFQMNYSNLVGRYGEALYADPAKAAEMGKAFAEIEQSLASSKKFPGASEAEAKPEECRVYALTLLAHHKAWVHAFCVGSPFTPPQLLYAPHTCLFLLHRAQPI